MPPRPVYPPAFHDVLAGTAQVAAGGAPDTGSWQVWADPDDRDPYVYAIELPPAGQGGAVALVRFTLLIERSLAVTTAARSDPRRLFVAATADATAQGVVVTDAHGTSLELDVVYTRPWWSHRLFVGSTSALDQPVRAAAYDADGRTVGDEDLTVDSPDP